MQTQRDGLSDLESPPHLHRRVTSFRSRRASLTDAQQRTWARLWPELGTNARGELLDTGRWFGRSALVVLEIGCGTGTSTAAMAEDEPHVDVVAVEVYRKGLAQLLGAIDREQITNIRLIRGDGVDVLEHMFAPESLTGVRVFFPDPWPKSRHHKRRLLQPGTVALIADRLRARWNPARRHRPRGLRRADRGGRRRRTAAAPRTTRSINADLGPTADHEVRDEGAATQAAPSTELLWEKAHPDARRQMA